jgi:hypothetical protein
MFTHEALIDVPTFADVKLCCSGANFQLELELEYWAARIFPATSCMNSHRSPSTQLVAAREVLCRSFETPAGKPVVNKELEGVFEGFPGVLSEADEVDLDNK